MIFNYIQFRKRKSISLIELIIAIALLGVIVLGAVSFDTGSRHLLRASETKTQVQNDAALILDYITKDAASGIGDRNNPALRIDAAGFLLIQQDGDPSNGVVGNGVRDAGDHVIAYGRDDNNIIRCNFTNPVPSPINSNTAGCQILSRRAVHAGSPTPPLNVEGFLVTPNPIVDNTAHVRITLRFRPATDPANPNLTGDYDALGNPQVTSETDVEVPGQSLQ